MDAKVRDFEQHTVHELVKTVWGCDMAAGGPWLEENGAMDKDQFFKNAAAVSDQTDMAPVALFVAPQGRRIRTASAPDQYEPAMHFMVIVWMLIQGKVYLLYSDALQLGDAEARVQVLTKGCKLLQKKLYPQITLSIRSSFAHAFARDYEDDLSNIVAWLGELRYNGHNSCPFDTTLVALLNVFHAGIVGRSGVIVIPGAAGVAQQEVCSAQNFLCSIHQHRHHLLDLNAARDFLISWMGEFHVAASACLQGGRVVPAQFFQKGRMLPADTPLRSLLEAAAGTKIRLNSSPGVPQGLRSLAHTSTAWLAPSKVMRHLSLPCHHT